MNVTKLKMNILADYNNILVDFLNYKLTKFEAYDLTQKTHNAYHLTLGDLLHFDALIVDHYLECKALNDLSRNYIRHVLENRFIKTKEGCPNE